jgi:SAM-dependent methyltransferase
MPMQYDKNFMQYAAQSSAYSASSITGRLAPLLSVQSVLDVGCACGTWIRAWSEHGVADGFGVDGDYVDRAMLEIPAEHFRAIDLNAAFDLGRTFDLVQSLEVAEHLQPAASGRFVESLVRHASRFILFSAAPPGQGGEYHINEQPFEFWRAELGKHGFVPIDAVRPLIQADQNISYWYRYNVFLYVRRELAANLPAALRDARVPESEKLADVSPASFRIRKAVVRRLPYAWQSGAARLKARLLPTGRI